MAMTALWFWFVDVPTIATMNWHTTMPTAPQMRSGRLPNFSTVKNETGVDTTLTSARTRDIKKGFLTVPRLLKKLVPK
jgi:hypothetical protein